MSLAIAVGQLLTWSVYLFAPGNWSLTGLAFFFGVTIFNVKVNDESHEAVPVVEGMIGIAAFVLHLWMPGALVFDGWALPGGWGLVALGLLILTNLLDQRNQTGGGS